MAEQLDLKLDSPLHGKVKGERSIMEFPFFDLARTAKRKKLLYRDDNTEIEVKAVEGQGIATIYDKDLLLYVASLMVEKMNAGEVPDREFVFTAHDFFRVAGRDTSKRSYENLMATVERLKGTLIRTNIETGGEGIDGWFNWLDSGTAMTYRRCPRTGEKKLRAVRVVLCTWLYRAILKDGRILTYHSDYFDLAPVQRRLYDLARSHCGYQDRWVIGMERLHKKVGSTGELKKFRALLEEIEQAQSLPEYSLHLVGRPTDPVTAAAVEAGLRPKRAPSLGQIRVMFMPKGKTLPPTPSALAAAADA